MNHVAPYLLIDAGNSRIKWTLAHADGTSAQHGAFNHVSADLPPSPADEPDWSALPQPGSAWISNVAGEAVQHRLDTLIGVRWPGLPRTVIHAQAEQCGVRNGYASPGALGSDRWAGMIGARAAFPGEALLIATFGTATTLEALRADGAFVGGLIAPGWSLMMRSLGEHTAQLPTLEADAARSLLAGTAQACFATDTAHALSAGCALAQTALVERMWTQLQQEWGAPVRLVIGGGAAADASAMLAVPHTRHDALVLAGLAQIARAP